MQTARRIDSVLQKEPDRTDLQEDAGKVTEKSERLDQASSRHLKVVGVRLLRRKVLL